MLRLIRTESPDDWKSFHELARAAKAAGDVHSGAVSSLQEEAALFHFSEHPFFRHGLGAGFLVLEGDRALARLAAFIDLDFVEERKEKVGFLGFFAALPNTPDSAWSMLLDAARDWLLQEGMVAALAPVEQSFWRGMGLALSNSNSLKVALSGKGWSEVVRGVQVAVDLATLTWPAEYEGRAEVARQATRVQLIEQKDIFRKTRWLRLLESLARPGQQRIRRENDLTLRMLVLGRAPASEVHSPWERIPGEADWVSWRDEVASRGIDLEVRVAGELAGWIHLQVETPKKWRVRHLEISPSYRDFDLLPWCVISTSRWALDAGAQQLVWECADQSSALGVTLEQAFEFGDKDPRVLLGAPLAGPRAKRSL